MSEILRTATGSADKKHGKNHSHAPRNRIKTRNSFPRLAQKKSRASKCIGGHSENDIRIKAKAGIRAVMLDTPIPIVPEKIEAQRVFLRRKIFQQLSLQGNPLSGINTTFENGILHALPEIFADFCNA